MLDLDGEGLTGDLDRAAGTQAHGVARLAIA
jgi:hypothetical protein